VNCPRCEEPKPSALKPCPCSPYWAKLEKVGSCLYSLDPHLCRWEDASDKTKEKYRHKAHLARVWWQMADGLPPTESV